MCPDSEKMAGEWLEIKWVLESLQCHCGAMSSKKHFPMNADIKRIYEHWMVANAIDISGSTGTFYLLKQHKQTKGSDQISFCGAPHSLTKKDPI